MDNDIHLSLVIPAFNEEEILLDTLEKVHSYLEMQSYTAEIIPIDDGSSDRTSAVAEEFARTHPSCRPLRNSGNRGKGYTVRRGIREARGEIVLFTDADLSTPIDQVDRLLARFSEGYDVVIGSRDLPDSDIRVHQPWYRETMGKIFNRIVRMVVLGGYADTQCGFKAFRRARLGPLVNLLRIDTYSFDVEILFLSRLHGLRIKEEPIVWVNHPDTRVNALTDSTRMFIDLFLIRYYHLRGFYRRPSEIETPGKGENIIAGENRIGRE